VSGLWKHLCWEKSVTKDHILYGSTYRKCLEKATSQRQEMDWC
jgi:hypothetical protein